MPMPTVIWNERRINGTLTVYPPERSVGWWSGRGGLAAAWLTLRRPGGLSVFAAVTSLNPFRPHKRMGFKPVGTYLQAGFKNGVMAPTSTGIRRCLVTILMTPAAGAASALGKDSILKC